MCEICVHCVHCSTMEMMRVRLNCARKTAKGENVPGKSKQTVGQCEEQQLDTIDDIGLRVVLDIEHQGDTMGGAFR
jgi:hypothetical protein